MKFRVLFIAVALLALTSWGFGQPQDATFAVDYPGDWDCGIHMPLTSGVAECWQGTPIPDGTTINVMKNGSVFMTWPMNSLFICGTAVGGFFSTNYFQPYLAGDRAQLVVTHGNCTYWTTEWTLAVGDNYFAIDESAWSCTCGTVQEYDDLGDIDFTPVPPPSSVGCPNPGPQGVPYATAPHPAGPCHALSGIAWLGTVISAEAAPKFSDLDDIATGGDDGVFFVPGAGPHAPAWERCVMQTVMVKVTAGQYYTNQPLFLCGWKDGNVDGDFADVLCMDMTPGAPEWIIQNVPVVPGPNPIPFSFIDPGCDDVQPYTGVYRFRLTSRIQEYGDLWWNGGHDVLGEVEDYYRPEGGGAQLPVELTAAPTVTAGDRELTLSFNVSDQTDVNTYEIWRDDAKVTEITKASGSYSYADRNLVNNRLYNYTIVAVGLNDRKELSFDGKTVWSGSPSYLNATVTEYALHQNYPNPFNPSTEIVYDVLQTGVVTLKVFNVMGQEVATLVNGTVEAGRHAATFNATGLTSGLYFYTITIGDQFSATKKMLLVQ